MNQVACTGLLLILATAAGIGKCRIPTVRHGCTLTALWLTLSPVVLPGAFSGAVLFGGLAISAAAAWAAETIDLRQERGD